jgi:hypothetical protein
LDEVPPQSRKLLQMLGEMAEEAKLKNQVERRDYRFTRREVREYTGWSDFQVQVHLQKLTELEYVLVHRGGRGQSLVYELLFEGDLKNPSEPRMMGLIDVERLGAATRGSSRALTQSFEPLTQSFLPLKREIEGSIGPQIAPIEGGSRPLEMDTNPQEKGSLLTQERKTEEKTPMGGEPQSAGSESYPMAPLGGRQASPREKSDPVPETKGKS